MTTPEDSIRVSTLELFFDLVFVFTITQLTAILLNDPHPHGLFSAILMLGVTWWMYGGYAWLTNAVPPTTTSRRLLLMAGMTGFLVMALAIPGAFGGSDGLAFGLGYLLVTAVHTALFTKTTTESAVRAILRLAPFNFVSAILVLVAGIAGGTAEFVLWSAAFCLQVIAPYLSGQEGFVIQAAHFVERHGLVVIIAFGESIVAIGIGATNLPLDAALVFVAVLGLALTGCLWWLYFGGDDDEEAERALGNTPNERRPHVALWGYGYAHLALLFGVVMLAAGVKKAIGHAFEHASGPAAWYLAGGVSLYLVGDAVFRGVLGIGRSGFRVLAAVVALLTVPIGQSTVVVAQLGALVVVLFLTIVAERVRAGQVITR